MLHGQLSSQNILKSYHRLPLLVSPSSYPTKLLFSVTQKYVMTCVCVFHFSENNTISVWNNGKGIPVVEHKVEKVYVPALIFGQLLTSSNYDDDEKKVTGEYNN